MQNNNRLDDRLDDNLAKLGSMPNPALPRNFMDGVWLHAGQFEERSAARARLALSAAMAIIGLGAGFGLTQAPANAELADYQLVSGADLSPATLLHVYQ